MIAAGSLDRKITLERSTKSTNSLNEEVLNFLPFATVWANVSYRKTTESINGQQVVSTLGTRFVIRWSQTVRDVNPKDRVSYDGRTYDISGVYPIGRNEEIEIHATARAD